MVMAAFTFSLPPSSTRVLGCLSVAPSTREARCRELWLLVLLHPATSHLPVESPQGNHSWGFCPEKLKKLCAEELVAFTRAPWQSRGWCSLPSLLAGQVLDLANSRVPGSALLRIRSTSRAPGQSLSWPLPRSPGRRAAVGGVVGRCSR